MIFFLFLFLGVFSELKNVRVIKVNKDCIFVVWDRLDSDGGSFIIGYLIERKERNSLFWVKVNDIFVRLIEYFCVGFVEGFEYLFRIYVLNKVGFSLFSKLIEYVIVRMSVGE